VSAHHHHPTNYNRLFAIGVALNLAYVGLEAGFGFAIESLALIADAGHNLSDVLGLLLAWGAIWLASRPATLRRSYGLRRVTLLAALASAILLLLTMGAIAWEALGRFAAPRRVDGSVVMLVAALGVLINTATALLFLRDRKRDLNIRGAYLHMAADAAISLAVVVAGALIMITGWLWLDPAISLLVVLAIVVATWDLLKESINRLLDTVPTHIDPAAIEAWLREQPGVSDLHDLHIWSVSTTEVVLTVHLVMPDLPADDQFLRGIRQRLFEQFAIGHSTVQLERQMKSDSCQQSVCS
jgi:cobalt-zinc-cadmium efflux system protein